MKLLMIATGYPPYLFSENLCNGKLVIALKKSGIDVDVISREDGGPLYGAEWTAPWDMLKSSATVITYPTGNNIQRITDVIHSGMVMGWNFESGVRWMRRATETALSLTQQNHYDALLTRSPNDISHLVGEIVKQKTGIKWIANWNDPASPIWPAQYKHKYSPKVQARYMNKTERLLKSADINTFPSDSLRRHFISYFPFLKHSNTEVIPHIGLSPDLWPKPTKVFSDRKLRFLHSGNLSSERNPETTFKALAKLVQSGFCDFEFHVMGHINDYTERLIDEYNLHQYVKVIGSFTYMEAISRMQSYDVLVLLEAKLDHGIFFASKFTDYLQTGLPILAISPINGFVADMLTGQDGEFLADNCNVDSIYSNLCDIVDRWKNKKLDQCMSSELFKQFSAEKVVDIYKSIIL